MKKPLSLDSKMIESQNISYCIFGEGDIDLVIEMRLGAVAGEWWHIHSIFQNNLPLSANDNTYKTVFTTTDEQTIVDIIFI